MTGQDAVAPAIHRRTALVMRDIVDGPDAHDAALADHAIERGRAYAEAGANGYFIPGLANLELVQHISRSVPLPVNAMHLPGGPSRAEWAGAGIARVSHGPFPYMAMQRWLTEQAQAALA